MPLSNASQTVTSSNHSHSVANILKSDGKTQPTIETNKIEVNMK